MSRMSRLLVVLGLLVLASAGPAMAALVGSNVRVSGGSATADDESPAVAWGSAGEYLVVWQDWRDAGTRGTDIYGQLMGTDGAPVGTNFRVSGADAGADDRSPAVAWNEAADEYLVVWQDWRDYDTRGHDTYGQRVAADGTLEGANFRVSGASALDDEYSPAVVWNETANQYLVIWQDYRDYETRGPDIYGQRLGGYGGAIGDNFRISGAGGTPTPSSKCWPAVAWNGTANQFLVVWEDGRNNTADKAADRGQDIYGQRLGGYGGLIGANFRISGGSATADDSEPAAVWNGSANQFLVVWQDHRDEVARGWDVYGQRLDGYGALIDVNFRISGTSATSDEVWAAVAWIETANRYLVTWADARNPGGARLADIYGQRLGAYGGAIDLNFRISGADATFDDWYPAVSCSAAENQCLVAWQDHRNEAAARGWDVYGQRASG